MESRLLCNQVDLENSHTSLVDNITAPLSTATKPIQQSMVDHFTKADPEFGKRVAKGLVA
jgi:catalase